MNCSTCYQESHGGDRHHGNHMLDLHHAPTYGLLPKDFWRSLGYVTTLWYAPDWRSYYIHYVRPDRAEEWLRVYLSDGERVATTETEARRVLAERDSWM